MTENTNGMSQEEIDRMVRESHEKGDFDQDWEETEVNTDDE